MKADILIIWVRKNNRNIHSITLVKLFFVICQSDHHDCHFCRWVASSMFNRQGLCFLALPALSSLVLVSTLNTSVMMIVIKL